MPNVHWRYLKSPESMGLFHQILYKTSMDKGDWFLFFFEEEIITTKPTSLYNHSFAQVWLLLRNVSCDQCGPLVSYFYDGFPLRPQIQAHVSREHRVKTVKHSSSCLDRLYEQKSEGRLKWDCVKGQKKKNKKRVYICIQLIRMCTGNILF